jgi:arylsulfatase
MKSRIISALKAIKWILIIVAIITLFDWLFITFSSLSKEWSISEHLNYFSKSSVANLIFFIFSSIILFLLILLLKRIKLLKNVNITSLSISSAVSLLIIAFFIKPINENYLPNAFTTLSLIINSLFFLLFIPLGILLYILYSKLKIDARFQKKSIGILSTVIVILFILLIITGFISPQIKSKNEMLNKFETYKDKIDEQPNFIIIIFDALRPDHLRCYNETAQELKHFDKFADEELTFTNAFTSAPWTTPSMMSMLTSTYATVHRCFNFSTALSPSILTIQEILKSVGYETSAVIANPSIYYKFGFSRGFDNFYEFGDIKYLEFFKNTRIYYLLKRVIVALGPNFGFTTDTTSWCTKTTISTIHKHNNPFFMWVHYLDPHSPYKPPEQYITDGYGKTRDETIEYLNEKGYFIELDNAPENDREYILNLYDAEINYLNDELGKLLSVLKQEELWDNSFIFITSDHGEAFLEHGYYGHGNSHYSEIARIPLLAHIPPRYNKADLMEINQPVSLIDFAPTFLDILNIPELSQFSGKSFLPVISDKQMPDREIFIDTTTEEEEADKTIYFNNYSALFNSRTGELEVYDLKIDPYQKNDISDKENEISRKLLDKILKWIDEMENQRKLYGEGKSVGLDDESLEEIRGLGYID